MLTDLTPPSKDTVCQTGLKRKIQQFIAYRRPMSWQKQAIAYGERLEENLPNQQPLKTGENNNTYLRQSRLQTYEIKKDIPY
jgi:hypothetical protein